MQIMYIIVRKVKCDNSVYSLQLTWGDREYKIFAGKPLGKQPLVRPRSKWEDNIKMNLRNLVCNDGR
jgi:hypothetical protein